MVINKTQKQIVEQFQQYALMQQHNSLEMDVNRTKYEAWYKNNLPRYQTAQKQVQAVCEKYLIKEGGAYKTEETGTVNMRGEKELQHVVQEGKLREDYDRELDEVFNKVIAVEV